MGAFVKVSKVNDIQGFPVRAATLYRWIHMGKHPELFRRLGRTVFVKTTALFELIEQGEMKKRGGRKPRAKKAARGA